MVTDRGEKCLVLLLLEMTSSTETSPFRFGFGSLIAFSIFKPL
jgi:hypothetical protein